MNKYHLLAIFMSLSTSVFAQKAKVIVLDEHMDTSSLENDYDVSRRGSEENYLPNIEARDYFLKDVPKAKNFDELEKDIFYTYLKTKNIEQLQARFPTFTKAELKKLKELRK